jgi:hypothetical protein
MNPFVYSVTSVDDLKTGILEYIQKGNKPTLAFVFSSWAHVPAEIGKVFENYDIDVFGATSFAEIDRGKIREGSITVMLLDILKNKYRLGFFGGEKKTSFEIGRETAAWSKTVFENPGLMVVTSLRDSNGDNVVNGIRSISGSSATLLGGMAGNDLNPEHYPIVYGSKISLTNGIAALVIDQDAVILNGFTSSGWKGIGTSKTVTRSIDNVLYTVDNQPAAEVYNKYLNISRESELYDSGQYGIQIEREDGSLVTRVATNFNDDGSILFAGTIPQGSKIKFSSAPGIELVQQTINHLAEFHHKIPEADAAVLFSCGARFFALSPSIEKETIAVSNLWEAPCMGFFTYGEFGPDSKGLCDFHNFTLSLVLLKEI